MTDVPALSFGLISLFGYVRAIRHGDGRWLGVGVAAALLAVLTRQSLIIAPLVAGLLLLQSVKFRHRYRWWLALILPMIVCLGASFWFSHREDITPMQLSLRLKALGFRPYLALHWCCLLVVPLACRYGWIFDRRTFLSALLFMSGGALVFQQWGTTLPYGGLFPYSGGFFSPYGIEAAELMAGERVVLLAPMVRVFSPPWVVSEAR